MRLLKNTFTTLLLSTSMANAADLSCFAKKNVDRGFDSSFTVKISPVSVGGTISLSMSGKNTPVGRVSSIEFVDKSKNPEAFNHVLAYVAEEDVSGVSSENLDSVTRIKLIKDTESESEAAVFELFAGKIKVGGTFFISGLGTSCL